MGAFALLNLVREARGVETWTGYQRFPGGVRRRCLVHKWVGSDVRQRKQFAVEAHLARWSDHPNVMRAVGFERSKERLFYALEIPASTTLTELLGSTHGPIDPELAITLVRGVARAMLFFHEMQTPSGSPIGLSYDTLSADDIRILYRGEVQVHPIRLRSLPGDRSVRFSASVPRRADGFGARRDVYVLGMMLLRLLRWGTVMNGSTGLALEPVVARIDPKWRTEVYRCLQWSLGSLRNTSRSCTVDVLLERLEQLPGGPGVLTNAARRSTTTVEVVPLADHTELDDGCRRVANA